MAWHRPGDKPLFEPMLAHFNDACLCLWKNQVTLSAHIGLAQDCSNSSASSGVTAVLY